ncbi:MAG: DMT family transporter [Rhizobiales bacterium]|nr:DMT family transporter [Hyphomicrobiales bacterium]
MSASLKGLLLGLLGVAIFAVSVPATKMATISPGFDGLPPIFIAIGRAAAAGLLAILYLVAVRAPLPTPSQAMRLVAAGLGIVIGFPLFSGLAVVHAQAIHVAVIVGALPLATAVMSALFLRERASPAFWAMAFFGFLLVIAFAWISGEPGSVTGVGLADLLALLSVLSASIGYVLGARMSREMRPEHVISWILVLYLPFTTAVALFTFPAGPVAPVAWAGFAYVSIFSMWLGFFAWYRGLAADPMRVSQVQLLQPFLSMLFAVPLLGERITLTAIGFCLAIIATVALSRKLR